MEILGTSIGINSWEIKRLDIDQLISIASQFRANIQIIEWEKWGNTQKSFLPFEKLDDDNAQIWLDENIPHLPSLQFQKLTGNAGNWFEKKFAEEFSPTLKFPPGFKHFDVRWMPYCTVTRDNGELVAYINYSIFNYATTWAPALVATNDKHHLLLRDSNFGWARLCIGHNFDSIGIKDKTKGAFLSLLQAWIDW